MNTEKYISKLFVFASIYLFVLILGGFFVLPGIFGIDDYSFPFALELFLKITATFAVVIVIATAAAFPIIKILQKPKRLEKSPLLVATTALSTGIILIFLHGLYVKLRTCSVDDNAWYCHVEGKSYVGMLVLAFFIATALGLFTWVAQKFKKN